MRFSTLRASFLLSTLATGCPIIFAATPYGVDLHGEAVHDLAGPGVRVVVLIFAASDCPISNRYVPEIARLNREFATQGARIWWVFPNAVDTAKVIAQHNREFDIHESTLLDTEQTLVRLAHASVTPEAAVFKVDGSGKLHGSELREVYRGRIDDRYLSIGQERPQPQHHDLEGAIVAALAGQSAAGAAGPPVGCSIVYLQK